MANLWPQVPHKTLIAWSQEARTTPVSQVRRFIRANPQVESRIFRNTALLPHDERAEAFNEEAKKFLLSGM